MTDNYRSIDLFAGIGGIRLGFEHAFKDNISTVFVSEWDEYAQQTYRANFGEVPEIAGDITKIDAKDVPDFDICLAGFPCQAFSIAGKKQGFNDDYKGTCRGTLFADVVRICDEHKPKVIFCENVKGLKIHDKGRTLKVIIGAFKEIGYNVYYKILNSKDYGVPQNRERIYIVAFRNDIDSSNFQFPQPTKTDSTIREIMEEDTVSSKYYLSTVYLECLRNHKARHEAKGNGFGYEIKNLDSYSSAIVCGGMGKERNLIIDNRLTDFTPVTHIKGEVNREGIRKMTPREWARLQGFPDDYKLVLADTHLYKQFGNSVTVPVIEAIAKEIKKILECSDMSEESSKIQKGNAGEWSEPYVLMELLAEGRIYNSDENMNVIKDVWHDISSIIFKEDSKDKEGSLEYIIDPDEKTVRVLKNGNLLIVIQRDDFRKYASGLKDAIKTSKSSGGTIDIPDEYKDFLYSIGRKTLKASSKQTPDIWLKLPDVKNTSDKPLGFSIKSRLSKHLPTIFNSSAASSIIYEITGPVNEEKISILNSLTETHIDEDTKESWEYPDYPARIEKFKELGLGLKFIRAGTVKIDKDKLELTDDIPFQKNLMMVDGDMPLIIAMMTAEAYFNGTVNISKLVEEIDKKDPLNVSPSKEYPYYAKKVKDLLVAMTLSMTASKVWDGTEGTNGGMIIVKEDGDIVCYHIFDRNDFRNFLFNNMKYEFPSNLRYHSMGIVKDGERYCTILNVQIRMGQRIKTTSSRTIKGKYDVENCRFYEEGTLHIIDE